MQGGAPASGQPCMEDKKSVYYTSPGSLWRFDAETYGRPYREEHPSLPEK